MAKIIDISDPESKKKFRESLQREIQSTHLNFLIGSGCSKPAISVLGNIEQVITDLKEQGKDEQANSELYEFILPLLGSTQKLVAEEIDDLYQHTLEQYSLFLEAIAHIIFERKGSILPKQASIFTTNYDLFIEKSSDTANGAYFLNDGFIRNPSLTNKHIFLTSEFFVSRKKRGYHYNYEVEVPSINLIKLHGSFGWSNNGENIYFSTETPDYVQDKANSAEVEAFNDALPIIIPNKEKFRDTLLNQTHYDLLRIYANELEKENTLLMAVGFSFADEHLLDITKRALRNPTLKLIIMCYSNDEASRLSDVFTSFSNVRCINNSDEIQPFSTFVSILNDIHSPREGG